MANPTQQGLIDYANILRESRVSLGIAFAGASFQFFLTGTSTPTNIYQDGNLTTPFSPTANKAVANSLGVWPAIYLDPSITYKVELVSAGSVVLDTWDPYYPAMPQSGASQTVQPTGMVISPFGEVTMTEASSGGGGVELEVFPPPNGAASVRISASLPGQVALIVNGSATTGAHTATFTATNKPGQVASQPVGWLPIKCDGTIYYTPLWRGDVLSPYGGPSGVPEQINSQAISGQAPTGNSANFTWNNDGSCATNVSATPSSWATPSQTGIGSSYWVNVVQNSGHAVSLQFGSLNTWVSMASGQAINLAVPGGIGGFSASGTYQISSSGSGSPVVASGTWTMSTLH